MFYNVAIPGHLLYYFIEFVIISVEGLPFVIYYTETITPDIILRL